MSADRMASLAHRAERLAAVQALLIERLYLEVEAADLDPDAPLFGSGHGLDSIDAVELIVALEEAFGVKLEEARVHAVRHLRTLNNVVDRVIAQEGA
jgi:acyl carrier protein